MKAKDFKNANKTLLKPKNMTDDECSALRIWTDKEKCVSCWEMSWKERISALIYGKIWLYVLSGSTQPPVALLCERDVFNLKGDNEDEKRCEDL